MNGLLTSAMMHINIVMVIPNITTLYFFTPRLRYRIREIYIENVN